MVLCKAAVVAGLAWGLMSTASQAAYIVNIEQVDGNVVATGSGSLNISGLDYVGSALSPGGNISPFFHVVALGSGYADAYTGSFSGPSSFGSGLGSGSDTQSGPAVVLAPQIGIIYVPFDYVSRTKLGISTSVFDNQTLTGLGLNDGTYKYTFGSGKTKDSITINIGISAVPLPAAAPMFGAALLALGAVGYGLKRKKADAAT